MLLKCSSKALAMGTRHILERGANHVSLFNKQARTFLNFFNNRAPPAGLSRRSTSSTNQTQDADILKASLNVDAEKLEIFKSMVDAQKLKDYQIAFYNNTEDPKSAYFYFRELNRQKKFSQVVELFEKHRLLFLNDPKSSEYRENINEQYYLAKHELDTKRASEAGGTSGTPRKSKNTFRRIIIYIMSGSLLFYAFTGISPFEKDGSDPNNMNTDSLMDRFLKRNNDIQAETNIPTRFSDVLGIDEFKEELLELVDYLKNPQKYAEVGAKIPKGILLSGPPGTGKTLLARALAGEAGCSFFYKSGSEFDEVFVGLGASRVRELFKTARSKAPAIIFIDEIDSVAGKRRSTDPSFSRDTINQILAEMDGFKQTDSVIVIGATNFEEALDPAIKRPGRFDKIINVPLPDIKGREDIFRYYLKKIKHDSNVDSSILARQSSGYSGADIQNVVNLAILNAVKDGRPKATKQDFEFAHDRIAMGIGRKKMFVSDKAKLTTAYHEGGHALASIFTEGAMPLHKVTILPRGPSLGHTAMLPEQDDDLNMTRRSILASIDVAMGGRAAEELIFGEGELTSGCGSDLANATRLAYQYVRGLGMVEDGTFIVADSRTTSDRYNYLIDKEVQKILKDSYDRVKSLLRTNEEHLKTLALELIRKETLSAEEVREALKLRK